MISISPVVMSPQAMSASGSPSSSRATLSPPFRPFQAPQRRATAPVTLVEPLTFTKVAISPAPSAVNSTDSEAFFSDGPSAGAGSELSRSPSLLTSLIRCQGQRRSPSGTATTPATTPGVSPQHSPLPSSKPSLPCTTTRPILRRSSTGAHTSNDERPDLRLQLAFGGLESVREQTTPSPLQRKRSCLKFAVTPRPLQLPSAFSSRRSSRTSPRLEELQLDEEDDDEEVATPWDSDDAGYQEDSEDGFTSDEDDGHGMLSAARRWPPKSWQPATVAPPPILSTPRRRVATLAVESTTDDAAAQDAGPRRRRIRIRADDEDRKCSRHRSPPPASSHVLSRTEPAPPAARSPSAFGLCRRRSGAGAGASVTTSGHALRPPPTRGWKSDDNALAGRSMLLAAPRARSPSVKFEVQVGAEAKQQPRNHAFALARRDSAPACVDEVHVLATQSVEPCPLRGLRRVLGQ